MTKSTTARRLRTALAATVAVVALAATNSPASAQAFPSPADADAMVFVPRSGSTVTIRRNGHVVHTTRFPAARSFEGNFTSATGTDVFLYNPGPGPDGILHVSPSGETVTTSFTSRSVNGTFQPIVGDFDGNGLDDVFWYAKGTAADALWLSKAAGGYTSVPVSVNGTFRPLAIRTNADAYEDIIWYAPGTGADTIWRFGPGGSHTSHPITINGDYQLVPGYFLPSNVGGPTLEVIFYNKAGADSMWRFTDAGGHTTTPLPNIDGTATVVVGRGFTHSAYDQVFFYRGGPPTERLLGFADDGTPQLLDAPNVSGNYDVLSGNFDGNPYDDVAFTNGGTTSLWLFDGDGYDVQTLSTPTDTVGRTAYRYPPQK